jgi:hypothetical protein
MRNLTPPDRYTLALIVACVVIGLVGIITLLGLAAGPIYPAYGANSSGTPVTIEPMFYDPRLSITLAYPFAGPPGSMPNPTALPGYLLPQIVIGDFQATQGVNDCTALLLGPGSLAAICHVDTRMNVITMAELLRLLANRQYYGLTLRLTLDDGLSRTLYLWQQHTWRSVPSSGLDFWTLYETAQTMLRIITRVKPG